MLSDNIRNYRKENNMSQDELAEKLNVSRQSVSLWENGQTQPTIDNIIALSKIFNVSANDLLGYEAESTAVTQKPPVKSNKPKVWLIILIVGIAVVIAVLLCCLLLGRNKTNVENRNAVSESSSASEITESKPDDAVSSVSKANNVGADSKPTAASKEPETFDLFAYCKDFAIQKGHLNGDYVIYQQPSNLYGGYDDEYFSISYWGDTDKVEFCLHCPLDETYSINFYLRMRGGYDGKYEYLSSRYYRSDGKSIRDASGYIDPSVFSEKYPLSCDSYVGSADKQNDFMEESRIGICDLIKCLKKFTEVENMECDFSDFGFVNF